MQCMTRKKEDSLHHRVQSSYPYYAVFFPVHVSSEYSSFCMLDQEYCWMKQSVQNYSGKQVNLSRLIKKKNTAVF